jgi:hypothetical protein
MRGVVLASEASLLPPLTLYVFLLFSAIFFVLHSLSLARLLFINVSCEANRRYRLLLTCISATTTTFLLIYSLTHNMTTSAYTSTAPPIIALVTLFTFDDLFVPRPPNGTRATADAPSTEGAPFAIPPAPNIPSPAPHTSTTQDNRHYAEMRTNTNKGRDGKVNFNSTNTDLRLTLDIGPAGIRPYTLDTVPAHAARSQALTPVVQTPTPLPPDAPTLLPSPTPPPPATHAAPLPALHDHPPDHPHSHRAIRPANQPPTIHPPTPATFQHPSHPLTTQPPPAGSRSPSPRHGTFVEKRCAA